VVSVEAALAGVGMIGLLLNPSLDLLRRVPIWVWIVAVALAWGGWQRHRVQVVATTLAKATQKAAAEREKGLADSIAETTRRLAVQQEVNKHDLQAKEKAVAAAASSAAAVDRLRKQLAAGNPGPVPGDPVTGAIRDSGRLAELLGECADRYRVVAEKADRAVIAGSACQGLYESLTK
jgi:hypothetical protein